MQVCKEESSHQKKVIHSRGTAGATTAPASFHLDEAKVTRLESRVRDLESLNKECREVIGRQQVELEEKNKKILKLELNRKARVVTQHERPLLIDAAQWVLFEN